MGIAVGCKHFDHAVANLDDGYIKGTAAQVIYHDLLLFLIVKTVSQSCRRRLVDDTLYFQTGNLARILGGLTLCIIKICRNRDHCLGNLLSQITLGICLQLLEDHSGNLLG